MLDVEMSMHKKDVERALVKKWIPAKGSTQMNAVIVSIAGAVRIYKKGSSDWSEAKINEVVSEGDKLQTAEDGRAEVRLSNGNTLLVQSGTELAFTTLRYDPASGNFENTFEMTRGKVSGVVEKMSKQSTFQLKTATAVCGVRGTMIEVSAPVSAAGQGAPQTQVFFEGGNGVVTSTLTGQSQEVGAGQNVGVDISGNISLPAITSVEQRTSMAQVWATVQTVDSYSTAQGAAGLNGSAPQQSLPQSPGPGPMAGEKAPAPIANEVQNLALLSTLTFNEVIKPSALAGPSVIYENTFSWEASGSSGPPTNCDANVKLYSDGTWHADIINGQYNGGSGAWEATLGHGVDSFVASGTAWSNGNWSGSVDGVYIDSTNPHKLGTGTVSGTSQETGSNTGTFTGTGSGTWHDN